MNSSKTQNDAWPSSTGSLNWFLSEIRESVQAAATLRPYRDNPAAFVHDLIDFGSGPGPAIYQDEILEEFPVRRRVSVRGPHGLGKSAIQSWVTLWGVMTADDVKVPTLASKWRQLTKFLWPEIHKWARRLRWDKLGRDPFSRYELLTLSLRLSPVREAFALTSDDPSAIEGAHADRLIYVFDESKTIPAALWDSAEGAFSTGEGYWLATSTPGEPSGRFYDIHSRKPGFEDWWVRHVTIDEAIAAGRVSKDWADARLRQWGEGSAVYQNRVLGEFSSTSGDKVVIPLPWIEAAVDRWHEWHDDPANWKDVGGDPVPIDKDGEVLKPVGIGVDVGRGGDASVQAPRFDLENIKLVPYLHKLVSRDIMPVVGAVIQTIARYGGSGIPIVDVIGIGAGVVDRLREQGVQVDAFNASSGTKRRDSSGELEFLNKRAAAWWGMRERLDPVSGDNVALPPDDLLIGELAAPTWDPTSAGKVKVESKDDIRTRIGRSTDHADAVVQSFFGPYLEGDLFR